MSTILTPAFFAGSPGPMELIVIFLLILVLFGPRRLPEIAKMIGKTIHELRKASEDFKDQVMSIESDPVEDADVVTTTDADEQTDPTDSYDQDDPYDMSDYDEYDDQLAEDVLSDDEVEVADPVAEDVAEEDRKEQAV